MRSQFKVMKSKLGKSCLGNITIKREHFSFGLKELIFPLFSLNFAGIIELKQFS